MEKHWTSISNVRGREKARAIDAQGNSGTLSESDVAVQRQLTDIMHGLYRSIPTLDAPICRNLHFAALSNFVQ
jgi:hypothetical protein